MPTIRRGLAERRNLFLAIYRHLENVLVVPLFLLAVLGVWRDEGPTDKQPGLLSDAASWLPWWGWLLLALSVLLFLTFEGAHREIEVLNQRLEEAPGSDSSPIVAPVIVHIEAVDAEVSSGHMALIGGPLEKVSAGERAVSVRLYVWADSVVRIEQIELQVAGQRCPSTWVSDVVGGVPIDTEPKFTVPANVSSGTHPAILRAYAEGKWFRSGRPLSVDVPTQPVPSTQGSQTT